MKPGFITLSESVPWCNRDHNGPMILPCRVTLYCSHSDPNLDRNITAATRRRPVGDNRHPRRSDRHRLAIDRHVQILWRNRRIIDSVPKPIEGRQNVVWTTGHHMGLHPSHRVLEGRLIHLAQIHRLARRGDRHKRFRPIGSPRPLCRHQAHCQKRKNLRQKPHVITPLPERSHII